MSDGLEWIEHVWRIMADDGNLYFTCARGIGPQELATRVAGGPVHVLPALKAREIGAIVNGETVHSVGRIGTSGEWSYLVETGWCPGWDLPAEVSRDGAEVLVLDPQPDNPPHIMTYAKDGRGVSACMFDAYGDTQGPLRNAFIESGMLADLDEEKEGPTGTNRRLLRAVGEYFNLSLPRRTILEGRLPAVITRTSPLL
ncbi:hypothetical protein [Streptomyces sp. AA1529]|uniref:hypothetical protein n=1 Tax=Streptomyces sp. AA1529 TaxID=1203257 RepID=UPI003D70BB9B